MKQWFPCRYLTVDQAESGVKPELRKYARVAWTFLNTVGYINFGVASGIAAKALKTPATRGNVIIVGAGLAGKTSGFVMQDTHRCIPAVLSATVHAVVRVLFSAVNNIAEAALQASLLRASCVHLASKWLYLRDMAGLEAGCTQSALRCAQTASWKVSSKVLCPLDVRCTFLASACEA